MKEVLAELEAGVGRAYPGAVAWIGSPSGLLFHEAVGRRAADTAGDSNTVDTVYDLASLTKPMAVFSLCHRALGRGQIRLTEPVAELLHPQGEWDDITVGHLLGHTAGFEAWRLLARDSGRADVLSSRRQRPAGATAVYSDIGYLALGFWLEARFGAPLDVLFDAIVDEYTLGTSVYRPLLNQPLAPTSRQVPLGQVHDTNCRNLGGVSGHAGLFGTAADVGGWALALLERYLAGDCWLRQLWHTPSLADTPTTWRLGWDTVTAGGSSAGSWFGPKAGGHLGYTGTSVWIEPERGVVAVLLSNRVHPEDRPDPEIRRLRPRFHDAVARTLSWNR